MNTLSPEQLQELTDTINARIAQEYAKWQFDNPPRLMLGAVEVAYEVIEGIVTKPVVELEEPAPIQISSVGNMPQVAPRIVDNMPKVTSDIVDNMPKISPAPEPSIVEAAVSDEESITMAEENFGPPPAISNEAQAILGPEHVVTNPVKADPDDDVAALRMGKAEKAATLREILTELQVMSIGGAMPTQSEWNANKPGHLPKADAMCKRYELSWVDLARYAKLTPSRPGRKDIPHAARSKAA